MILLRPAKKNPCRWHEPSSLEFPVQKVIELEKDSAVPLCFICFPGCLEKAPLWHFLETLEIGNMKHLKQAKQAKQGPE